MAHYGIAVTAGGTTYYYVIDTQKQVKQLVEGTTAPIEKLVVQPEGYGMKYKTFTDLEVYQILLGNHVEPSEVAQSLSLA